MAGLDDFDWVDIGSGRGRKDDGPSGVDQPDEYDPYRSTTGTDRAGDSSSRSGGQPYQTYSYDRTGGRASSSRQPVRELRRNAPDRRTGSTRGRPPRRTVWSQIAGSSRDIIRRIARWPRPVLLGFGMLTLVIILSMALDSALFYSKVHAGVSMAQQGLGGKTYDEALALVDQRVEELSTQPITLVKDSRTWTLTPDQVGQLVDIDASVQAALQVTRGSNFIGDMAHKLGLYFGGDNTALVGQVDQDKFDAFVAQIASELDVLPVSQSLSIQGDAIETVQAVNGVVVDREELEARLLDALFKRETNQIQIPMVTANPEVAGLDSAEAIQMVHTMLSGDVTLTYLAPPTTATVAQPPTCRGRAGDGHDRPADYHYDRPPEHHDDDSQYLAGRQGVRRQGQGLHTGRAGGAARLQGGRPG